MAKPDDEDQPLAVLEFVAPNRPLSENEKRRMRHWAQWRRRLDPWTEATQWAWFQVSDTAKEAVRRAVAEDGVDVLVRLPFKDNRRRDPHNYVGTNVKTIVDALTLKELDGQLVWPGAWPDDNPEFVSVSEPEVVVSNEDLVEVVLTRRTK